MRRRLFDTARGARLWWRVIFRNPMTTTLLTWRGGVLTMPCPAWCAGHVDAEVAQHPVDFARYSADHGLEVVAGEDTFEVLAISMAQAPLSMRISTLPYLTVDAGIAGYVRMSPDEVLPLADGLESHAAFLRTFVADVEPLRAARRHAVLVPVPGLPVHQHPPEPGRGGGRAGHRGRWPEDDEISGPHAKPRPVDGYVRAWLDRHDRIIGRAMWQFWALCMLAGPLYLLVTAVFR